MAERFVKQAKEYSASRPIYPEELFQFVASKTPCHDLVWDAGTGSGQAATSVRPLSSLFYLLICVGELGSWLQGFPSY